MESWQLSPHYLENHAPSYLSVEFLPTKLNLHYLFLSFPLDVCFESQLKRCSYVSLHESILSCPMSRILFPVEFLFVVIVLDEVPEGKDVKINMKQWIMKTVSVPCPPLSSYLTSWISRRDSCLVGASCHILSFWCCLVFASCLHHV